MGGLSFFYYFTVQFNHIYCVCVCVGKVSFPLYLSDLRSFELAMQDSHPSLLRFSSKFSSNSCTKSWFGIHRNVNEQFFFECHGKMFLSIEKVLEKISEGQT